MMIQLASTFSQLSLSQYMVLSSLLFVIGLVGFLTRRNLIVMYMGLELMLNSCEMGIVPLAAVRVVGRRASVADVALLAMCAERRHTVAALPGGLLRSLVDSRFFGSRDYFSDFAMETETEDDSERAFMSLHRPFFLGHRRLAAARPNGAAAGAMPGAALDGRPVLAERVEGEGGGFGGFGRVVRSLKRVAGRKPRQT